MRRLAQIVRAGLRALPRQGVVLLATLPFWLMSNSSQVWMNLKIERDGGALRQIAATVHPELKRELPTWVNKVSAGRPWDAVWQQGDGTAYTYMRDSRTQNANYGEAGQLQISDVLQSPLSVYTTYTWTEKVDFSYLYATDAAMAEAAKTQLKYVVTMPGTVTEAAAQPSKGGAAETQGSTATFSLSAAEPSTTVTVTSSKIRWGYLLVVVYALGWITLEVLQLLARLARIRPRKI